MILLEMGLPGQFAQWCDTIMARLLGDAGAEVAVTAWPPLHEMLGYEPIGSTLAQLARILIGGNALHLVVGARQPDDRLSRALHEPDARFVVALDDPRDAVASVLAETGAEPKRVVRAIANGCALIMQHDRLPGALRLDVSRASADLDGTAAAIAAHFRIAVTPQRIAAILKSVGAPGGGTGTASDKTVDGALRAYHEYFRGGRLGEIVWTRDLFLLGTGKSPTEPIEAAGGARILIYGPYIHLPPGSWKARVVLGFSSEACGHIFMVDACAANRQLAAASFQPDAAGVRTPELNFSLAETSGQGVEIRIMVVSEQARGSLAFGHVVLTPLALHHVGEATPSSDPFDAVLEL